MSMRAETTNRDPPALGYGQSPCRIPVLRALQARQDCAIPDGMLCRARPAQRGEFLQQTLQSSDSQGYVCDVPINE
jgi:hypothetical protein